MATGRTLVKKALQKGGIITKNETPSADETNDGLDTLNGMLSSWANESLLAYIRARESFTLSAGVASYTIGSGGDFDTVRPVKITSAFVRIGETDYPIRELLDIQYDHNIHDKGTQGIPARLLFERSVPLGTITLFPVPAEASTLFLRSEKAVTAIALDTDVALPEGWEHALIHNLAVLIGPEYGVTIADGILREAVRSKEAIKKAVCRNRNWNTPPLVGSGGFNVLTGRLD